MCRCTEAPKASKSSIKDMKTHFSELVVLSEAVGALKSAALASRSSDFDSETRKYVLRINNYFRIFVLCYTRLRLMISVIKCVLCVCMCKGRRHSNPCHMFRRTERARVNPRGRGTAENVSDTSWVSGYSSNRFEESNEGKMQKGWTWMKQRKACRTNKREREARCSLPSMSYSPHQCPLLHRPCGFCSVCDSTWACSMRSCSKEWVSWVGSLASLDCCQQPVVTGLLKRTNDCMSNVYNTVLKSAQLKSMSMNCHEGGEIQWNAY